MSKIARYTGNLRAFGSNAQGLERTLFGETTHADDLTSQITTAFLRGWGIVGPSENPSLEDFNAAMYTMSQFIAYQHQMGVPEWDAAQEYYIGSLCVRAGETYASLANSNINSAPPSAKWTQVITVKNGLSSLGLGTAATKNVGVGANQIPDMNSFASSLVAGGGYQKLPGGLVLQWGNGVYANQTTTSVTLPIAFPNAGFLAISCKGASLTLSGEYIVGSQIASLSTINISNTGGTSGGTKGIYWIALGY